MGIDLMDTLGKLSEIMGDIGEKVDSDLKDFSKNATTETAEKINAQAYEAVNAVKQANDQIAKVHYETKKRQG